MTVRFAGFALAATLLAACGGADTEEMPEVEPAPTEEVAMDMDVAAVQCDPMDDRMPLDGRASPYDSTSVTIGSAEAKICYGRPSMNGREIMGGLVPLDTLWRTGANEPTTIHIPFAASIAGIEVEPGSYSLYTVPGQDEWTLIVNRSITQWGIESAYSPDVRSQEVGRTQVAAEQTDEPVEMFTIEAQPSGASAADVMLRWENTAVTIPIERV